MIVAYSATRNLYPYLREAIASLLDHNKPDKIYVLAEDDEVGVPFDVQVINVSGQTYYAPDGPNMNIIFTYMSMMRLLYVDLLPDEDKVIQLDVDTIVCDSLEPLWNIDLTGKWFAGCPEYKGRYKPFGDDLNRPYYNVGVMVFNLDQMRRDGYVPDMVKYLNSIRLWCTEQDVLNLYGVDMHKDKEFPTRYNETQFTGQSDDPAVVHYAGFPDWWKCGENLPRREYLLAYRRRYDPPRA